MIARPSSACLVVSLLLCSPGCLEQHDGPDPGDAEVLEPEDPMGSEECVELCDPVESDCPAGEGCLPDADLFRCQGLRQNGVRRPLHAECEPTSQNCDPGLMCLPVSVPGCVGGPGCCVSFCDVSRPECSPDTSCIPYFESSATCHQEVGVCVIGA
jgi:hypothetical protein